MKRLYFTRGFRSAFIDGNTAFYRGDFPKTQQAGRAIARADLTTENIVEAMRLTDDSRTKQVGPYVMSETLNSKDENPQRNVILEVRSARDGSVLWNMPFFQEVPYLGVDASEGRIVAGWSVETDAVKELIKSDETLAARVAPLKDLCTGVFCSRVLNASNGHLVGDVVVDTSRGSFHINEAYAAGEWLLIADNENRILVYSIADGSFKGALFGKSFTASSAAGQLAVENESGQLQIYSLPSLQRGEHITLAAPR